MGKNAKIGFIEMDEDRNMKNGVRAQITKTNPVIINQPAEEWMDWNTESVVEVIFKNY